MPIDEKQEKIDACIKSGICPTCHAQLVEYWNEAETHKFQVCKADESHHRKIIDYEQDND